MEPAFSYSGQKLRLLPAAAGGGVQEQWHISSPSFNQFAEQMDHFSRCVREGCESRTPGHMGLADLRIIAAINTSLHAGHRVSVKG